MGEAAPSACTTPLSRGGLAHVSRLSPDASRSRPIQQNVEDPSLGNLCISCPTHLQIPDLLLFPTSDILSSGVSKQELAPLFRAVPDPALLGCSQPLAQPTNQPTAQPTMQSLFAADQKFWPPIAPIFDFTLTFEDVVMGIVPAALGIILGLLVACHVLRNERCIRASVLLWLKMVRLLLYFGAVRKRELTAGTRFLPSESLRPTL